MNDKSGWQRFVLEDGKVVRSELHMV
jgi:hypothetical protein